MMRERMASAVESLTPGYFALVMATGIVSVGLALEHITLLSRALLVVCAAAFVTLLILTVWRFVAYRAAMVDDFMDPRRAFGFFTIVAGTNVLANRLAVGGAYRVALVLLTCAFLVWLVLGYVVPWTAALGRKERPVVAMANGTWFIWVVASQSVAVVAATLEPHFATGRRELALLAVMSWSIGVFLYGATGVIVMLRLMNYRFGPEELTPPYWVSMGALAITVLAGARIVEMESAPMVDATRGLIAGMSVVVWAFATWLIPVLVAAGVWRHVARRIPLRYEATMWSIIFPVGMYAVASLYLGRADHLPLVETVGAVVIWIALAAWLLTFVVMSRHVIRTVVRTPR